MQITKPFAVALIVGIVTWTGCVSPREAATLGAFLGRQVGTPLGVAVVTVEETFKTAEDVHDANPREEERRKARAAARPITPAPGKASLAPAPAASTVGEEYRYYRAEVIVKTRGAADIQELQLQETQDVTAFWGR